MTKIKSRLAGMGWAPELPSNKDWKFNMAASAVEEVLPDQLPSRRSHCVPVMDQGELGSCVGCATSYAVGYLYRTDPSPLSTVYSALYAYFQARVMDGTMWQDIDSGAYIRDSMDALRTIGIATNNSWPYKPRRFADKPSKSIDKVAARWKLGAHWRCDTLDDILRALAAGYPVVGGFTCYDSMFTTEVDRTGVIPMPHRTDHLEGGHAVHFTSYNQTTRQLEFQNSWGTGWGDSGYGFLPFDFAADRDLSDDFWALQAESPATTPWKD